jgi:glyoxylase I family protein
MPELACVQHIALTVTDVDRSVPWYERVLGLKEVARREEPESGLRKVVLRSLGDGLTLLLVQHPGTVRRAPRERRTGLDHVAFGVCSRAALAHWEDRLEEFGVPYLPPAPSRTLPGSTVLAFHDPDGIPVEIWADPQP